MTHDAHSVRDAWLDNGASMRCANLLASHNAVTPDDVRAVGLDAWRRTPGVGKKLAVEIGGIIDGLCEQQARMRAWHERENRRAARSAR